MEDDPFLDHIKKKYEVASAAIVARVCMHELARNQNLRLLTANAPYCYVKSSFGSHSMYFSSVSTKVTITCNFMYYCIGSPYNMVC